MKRIASFVLAVLLILSLCACSLPQAKPAEEPIDELELVEEAAEAAEAEAPEERPIMPEETAPEEAPIPDAPSEVQPENAEAAEMPEPEAPERTEAAQTPADAVPEREAPSGNGTAPAGDTSGGSGQGGSGQDSSGGSVTIPEPETGGDLVWIPTHGGTKYHRSARCSNMIDPIQVSRETAIANGFTACKRCY